MVSARVPWTLFELTPPSACSAAPAEQLCSNTKECPAYKCIVSPRTSFNEGRCRFHVLLTPDTEPQIRSCEILPPFHPSQPIHTHGSETTNRQSPQKTPTSRVRIIAICPVQNNSKDVRRILPLPPVSSTRIKRTPKRGSSRKGW